jgi:hypothetical protein
MIDIPENDIARQREAMRRRKEYLCDAEPIIMKMVKLRQIYAGPHGGPENEMRWTHSAAGQLYKSYEATLELLQKLHFSKPNEF